MEQIDLQRLANQFKGRKFGELVLEHCKKQPFEQLVVAMQDTLNSLPSHVRPEIEGMLDRANTLAPKREFWTDDCGQVLLFICSTADKELAEAGIRTDQNLLFDVFNLIVMNFAYSVHRDHRLGTFIESSIGKRSFLSRLFG